MNNAFKLIPLQYGNYVCGPDLELLPMIDHANVACGFHAG
jgi:lactam utilization protein B